MLLDVSNIAIGSIGADALAKELKEKSTLTAMSLSRSLIDEVVAAAMKRIKG